MFCVRTKRLRYINTEINKVCCEIVSLLTSVQVVHGVRKKNTGLNSHRVVQFIV